MRENWKKYSVIMMLVVVFLTGCGSATITKTKSYTFKVDTGDRIKVSLETNDGYQLSSDVPFVISKDEETLSQGSFIPAALYKSYVASVKNDKDAKILDEGTKNKCTYVMWNYNDTEFNYVIKVEGTKTGILLGNNVSEEAAKECFNRLEIEAQK